MTPDAGDLDKQLAGFENFLGFAHSLGATKVRAPAGVRISSDGQRVELFFSHADFPDASFGYRAKTPGRDPHEQLWLAEELATGALHRLMRDTAAVADSAGMTWLRLDGQELRTDS